MILSSNTKSIDLHGADREYAKILVKDFINDCIKLREEYAIVIHGIGKGIVKKAVYEELRINKNVLEYKQDNFNPGCTIIRLKVNKL